MADNYFGDCIASIYDEDEEIFDPQIVEPAVDFLAALAGKDKALEFGIGTGRIALPLARRGASVYGIDSSPPMIERLAESQGGSCR